MWFCATHPWRPSPSPPSRSRTLPAFGAWASPVQTRCWLQTWWPPAAGGRCTQGCSSWGEDAALHSKTFFFLKTQLMFWPLLKANCMNSIKEHWRGVQVERLHSAPQQLRVGLHGGVGSEVTGVQDDLSVRQEEEQHGGAWTASVGWGGGGGYWLD